MSTLYSYVSCFFGFLGRLFRNVLFQLLSFVIVLFLIGGVYAAWQSISDTEIAPGEKVRSSLFSRIKNNLDDLNARVLANPTSIGDTCSRNGSISHDSNGITISCQSGVWKYTGLQPYKNTYTISASRLSPNGGTDQGIPQAKCHAGDKLIGLISFYCHPSFKGILEGINSDNTSATILCDRGNNSIYDGGFISISCAQQ